MATHNTDLSNLPAGINVDAEARIIQSLAADTVQKILNKRVAMDAAGQQHEPLFVALGENHAMPTHKVHQLAVLDGLKRAGESCLMAFEEEHDSLLQDYEDEGGFERTPASDAMLIDEDTHGQLSLQSYMAFGGILKSDHMWKTLMAYCRQTGTPAAFSDAAINGEKLDKHDPSTYASIESCLGNAALAPEYALQATSPDGMHVRNHHMLTTARKAARQTDSRIILQQTGNSHIAGDIYDGDSAEHSLLGLSRFYNYAALGVIPSSQDFTQAHIDDATLRTCGAADELHWRDGLPEWKAYYHPNPNAPQHPDADMHSRAAEAAYASAILERLGMGNFAMSAEDYWKQKEADKQAMDQTFAEIDTKARRSPAVQPA